jgi:hypothetical protein
MGIRGAPSRLIRAGADRDQRRDGPRLTAALTATSPDVGTRRASPRTPAVAGRAHRFQPAAWAVTPWARSPAGLTGVPTGPGPGDRVALDGIARRHGRGCSRTCRLRRPSGCPAGQRPGGVGDPSRGAERTPGATLRPRQNGMAAGEAIARPIPDMGRDRARSPPPPGGRTERGVAADVTWPAYAHVLQPKSPGQYRYTAVRPPSAATVAPVR